MFNFHFATQKYDADKEGQLTKWPRLLAAFEVKSALEGAVNKMFQL